VVRHQPAVTLAQVSALVRRACPDWRAVRAWPLSGGVSAQVHAVETALPDGSRGRLVLRQYGVANLSRDPHAAVTEHRLLELLHVAGLPVPRPWLADESGTILPGPCLLTDYIDGEVINDPAGLTAFDGLGSFLGPLARTLAALHETGPRDAGVRFLGRAETEWATRLGTTAAPDETLSESAILAALAGRWPPRPANQPVILHGDYWPGNALWRDGCLAGIIDWEDAMFGDPLADVAVARQELWWFFGPAAARGFTDRYRALRPSVDMTALALWDLRAALRHAGRMAGWGLSRGQHARMIAAHHQFVSDALGRLTDPRSRS
jgi:aminoglycoside phosphotransferase (APT) family kinase protein